MTTLTILRHNFLEAYLTLIGIHQCAGIKLQAMQSHKVLDVG